MCSLYCVLLHWLNWILLAPLHTWSQSAPPLTILSNHKKCIFSCVDPIYSVLCNVYSILCNVYSILCNVYSILCNVYSILCNVYSILCNVYSRCFLLTCRLAVHQRSKGQWANGFITSRGEWFGQDEWFGLYLHLCLTNDFERSSRRCLSMCIYEEFLSASRHQH